MLRSIKAKAFIRFFDGDERKAERVLGLMKARTMVRRDPQGLVVAENRLKDAPERGGRPTQPDRGRP